VHALAYSNTGGSQRCVVHIPATVRANAAGIECGGFDRRKSEVLALALSFKNAGASVPNLFRSLVSVCVTYLNRWCQCA
jgi:hypothetical protein